MSTTNTNKPNDLPPPYSTLDPPPYTACEPPPYATSDPLRTRMGRPRYPSTLNHPPHHFPGLTDPDYDIEAASNTISPSSANRFALHSDSLQINRTRHTSMTELLRSNATAITTVRERTPGRRRHVCALLIVVVPIIIFIGMLVWVYMNAGSAKSREGDEDKRLVPSLE
jgi:hypothetical protein